MDGPPVCSFCKGSLGVGRKVKVCGACRRADSGTLYDDNLSSMIPSASIDQFEVAVTNESRQLSESNPIMNYYRSMNEWISVMKELRELPDYEEERVNHGEAGSHVRLATYCSFGINFMLLCGKALAMSTSASYTIMSSLADSCLDLVSGVIMSYAAANSKYTDADKISYPAGKSRVPTVGILVFAVLMSCCAIYVIMTCMSSLLTHEVAPMMTSTAVVVMIVTIFTKFTMWYVYDWIGHPITVTLAEDHRNDVLTNTLGLFMYWGGARFQWWMDSTGGILLSLFVLVSWVGNALENAKMLMGETAPADVIRNITYVAAHHNPLIAVVGSVVAYQLGPMYHAEVRVIMKNGICFEEAQRVVASLRKRLENIDDVEHAFVYLDTHSHHRRSLLKTQSEFATNDDWSCDDSTCSYSYEDV